MPQNQKPQSADVDVSTGGQAAGLQLPPALANLIAKMRDDRKALLKDKPVTDDATRNFLAHFFYPRLIESVEALGIGLTETYMVASQSLTETSRMRGYVDQRIASAHEDEDGFSRVDLDDLEVLREALAALGLLLQKKMPDDAEVQAAFNVVTEAFVTVGGDGSVDEEEDDDDDDGGGDDGDDETSNAPVAPVEGS